MVGDSNLQSAKRAYLLWKPVSMWPSLPALAGTSASTLALKLPLLVLASVAVFRPPLDAPKRPELGCSNSIRILFPSTQSLIGCSHYPS